MPINADAIRIIVNADTMGDLKLDIYQIDKRCRDLIGQGIYIDVKTAPMMIVEENNNPLENERIVLKGIMHEAFRSDKRVDPNRGYLITDIDIIGAIDSSSYIMELKIMVVT